MKKIFTGLKRNEGSKEKQEGTPDQPAAAVGPAARPADARTSRLLPNDDTPEANIRRAIKGFCESGVSKDSHQSVGKTLSFQFAISYRREPKSSGRSPTPQRRQGEEVLFLPTIVDSAECSPTAAKEAASMIKKYLDTKYLSEPQLQYNAVMVMRILADNPGRTFTRNLDERFAEKVKELFKQSRDPGVRQLLAETLDHFEHSKKDDEGLQHLMAVWHKQKIIMSRYQPQSLMSTNPQQLGYPRNSRRVAMTSLPPLDELAGRISEAQMSAKLLHQVLGSTPRNEVLENELIKEFVHRCRSASTSMQDFITCDSPPPDSDTMSTLIETNDILRIALARFDAIKESIEMQEAEAKAAVPNPVDLAARNDGPPDLENPFQNPVIPAPLTFPGRGPRTSPAATGRVPRIDTGAGVDESPVSPVSTVESTREGFRY
ncbi:hypothetical protein BDZ91DRAFT_790184 [Kalaharituber pfeilii]|nr:hypothetical protein BDZ91DRAFT_790184 [Kalaharituber pfeilii]